MLLREYISLVFETDDYRAEHTAPGKEDGSPLWDLTQNDIYPSDIYSFDAARLYGGSPRIMSIINHAHNKPRMRIKIYRAVPHEPSVEEQIADLESQKAYILKRGKVPPKVNTTLDSSAYYDLIWDKVEELKKVTDKKELSKLVINPGDWVTIDRAYAVQHGKSALQGQYKILSKTVRASELYTDGNSLDEWGWSP